MQHASDCATHNGPALPAGPCDCGDMDLRIQRLKHADNLPVPYYGSDGAAGLDLAAAIDEPIAFWPGVRCMVPTGFAVEIPIGHVGLLAVRSSLSKHGIALANGVGIIDCDYRGEVLVNLRNFTDWTNEEAVPFVLNRGDRIAQLLIIPVLRPRVLEEATLSDTARGAGGFGSTGA